MRDVLRNEKKYQIGPVEATRRAAVLRNFLREDTHGGADGYLIRSLYFDTEYDGDFFDKAHGFELRKKIRLRCYDPRSEFVLLEMKQKQGDQQRKRSLRVRREDAERLIACDYSVLLNYPEKFAAECYGLMVTRCYRPKTVIQYRRTAFVVPENNIRLTFDRRIEATLSHFDLFDPGLMMNPVMDLDQVVLEVKYNHFLLSYIKQMLGGLEQSQISASKYCLARQIGYQPYL